MSRWEPAWQVARAAGVELRVGRRSIERRRWSTAAWTRCSWSDGSRVECDAVLVGIGAASQRRDGGRPALALAPTVASLWTVAADADRSVSTPAATSPALPTDGSGYRRTEHWSAAAAPGPDGRPPAGRPAAATGPPVAYFWTEQFRHRLQVVGHVEPGLPPAITGGVRARVRARATATRPGPCSAVALLDRPDLLASARAEVAGAGYRAVA